MHPCKNSPRDKLYTHCQPEMNPGRTDKTEAFVMHFLNTMHIGMYSGLVDIAKNYRLSLRWRMPRSNHISGLYNPPREVDLKSLKQVKYSNIHHTTLFESSRLSFDKRSGLLILVCYFIYTFRESAIHIKHVVCCIIMISDNAFLCRQ